MQTLNNISKKLPTSMRWLPPKWHLFLGAVVHVVALGIAAAKLAEASEASATPWTGSDGLKYSSIVSIEVAALVGMLFLFQGDAGMGWSTWQFFVSFLVALSPLLLYTPSGAQVQAWATGGGLLVSVLLHVLMYRVLRNKK